MSLLVYLHDVTSLNPGLNIIIIMIDVLSNCVSIFDNYKYLIICPFNEIKHGKFLYILYFKVVHFIIYYIFPFKFIYFILCHIFTEYIN